MKYTADEAVAQIHMRETDFREKLRMRALLLLFLVVVLFGLGMTRN